jgi:hypothetical protein
VNNQAPELSPEARRIIGDARGADDPTAEDQSRVKARWLASVVAVAGVSSLTEAARAAGGIGWGLKVAGAALVMAAGAIGLYVALPSDAGRDVPHGAKSEAVARSGAIRGRFEKTPSGEHDALEGDAVKGNPRKANVREDAELSAGAHAPTAPEAGPAALLAVPVIAAPSVAPVVDAVPRAETAQPAPSVLEPAEVPTREGSALAVGVDAPATEAKAGPAAQVPTPAAARDSKGLRREPVAARAKPARAGASRAAPPSAEPGPLAPPAGSSKAANSQSGQLGEELTMLSEVRGSVQNGAPERALEQLARYRSRFSQPILGMEADALKVDALCKTGQREAARASARAFQNDWPGSPLERRVSAACP